MNNQISSSEEKLEKALFVKNQFIRNIAHEFHAPITGTISLAQILFEQYDNLTDKQRISTTEAILKSLSRLDNFESNLLSLSKFSNSNYNLKNKEINLSELIKTRGKFVKTIFI